MDDKAYELEKAYELMESGEFQPTIDILLEYLKQSPNDYEAQFLLSRAYTGINDFNNSFVWCKKAADEGKLLAAYALLALHYCEGVGVKKSGPDTLYYIKLAEESDDPIVWNSINLCKGIMYWQGVGVDKNVPLAYSHFKKVNGIELADEYIKVIEENYPINNDGKIDLKQHKRSKWATFMLWMTLLGGSSTLISSYATFSQGTGTIMNIIISAMFFIFPIFVLLWKKWAFWGMVSVTVLLPLIMLVDHSILSDDEAMIFIYISNLFFSLLSLLTLLIRRKGYCNPLCALTGKEDIGSHPIRRVFGSFLCYGEGEEYKLDSHQTKVFSNILYAGSAIMVLLSVWAAWNIAQKSFGLGVEWNIFKSSGLWTFFSVIGFFLQFFNWQHTSFEHVTEVTYADGSKKRYKSMDIIDNMEGSFLWPLISHLVLIPAMYGAIMYYILMVCLALIGSIMPYVLALLVIGSVYLYYILGTRMKQRKFRIALLITMSVLFALAYIGFAGNLTFDSANENNVESIEEKHFVRCTGNGVNLREQPNTSSAKLFIEASDSGRMIFMKDATDSSFSPYQLYDMHIVQLLSEEGEWYNIQVNGVSAYAMKEFFTTVYPATIEEGLERNQWMKRHLVERTSGKYKNYWLYYYENEMDSMTTFYFGKKAKDCILFTDCSYLSWENNPIVKTDFSSPEKISYEGCVKTNIDGEMVIDLKNVSDDFLDKIFEYAENRKIQLFYFSETNSFIWE